MLAPSRYIPAMVLAAVLAVLGFGSAGTSPTSLSASARAGERRFPKQVLSSRHAEKPDDIDDPHLSSRGAARAGALPSLFLAPPAVPTSKPPLPNPDYVFAASKSVHSDRCVD